MIDIFTFPALRIYAIVGCIFVSLRLLYSQDGFFSTTQYQARPGRLNPNIASSNLADKASDFGIELVVASMKHENTSWVHEYLPDWYSSIYVVDDPDAALTVPKNKGNEAMVYLTYAHPSLASRYSC